MYELVDYIVGSLIEKEQYEIMIVEDGDKSDIKVYVDKDAVNNIIGKGGKVAKAIRTIVRSIGQKSDKTYGVYVEER